MAVTLDKLSSSNVQAASTAKVAAPRVPRGLSDTSSIIQFGQKQNSTSCWDCFKAFFAAILNFITCGCFSKKTSESTSKVETKNSKNADNDASKQKVDTAKQKEEAEKAKASALNQALETGKQQIINHVKEENLKHLTLPCRAAVVFNVGDTVIGYHTAMLSKDTFKDFQKIALKKFNEAISDASLAQKDKLSINTYFVQVRDNKVFAAIWEHGDVVDASTTWGGQGEGISMKEAAHVMYDRLNAKNNRNHDNSRAIFGFLFKDFETKPS